MTLGPFSFSAGLLASFVAILAVLLVGNRVARARALDVDNALWLVIAVALLAARLVFVARHATLYAAAPLGILDIRDGGFTLLAGVCAGFATAALLGWRQRQQRLPLLSGAGAGGAVFALAALLALAAPGAPVQLPAMHLARLEGGTLSLPALAGRPVVLNLWASWCGPCRREMPVLRQAQLAHPEVTFIFVNQGETPSAITAYLSGQGIALQNVVLDARPGLGRVLDARALPTTFFFDSKGLLIERRVGELSAATLNERLQVQR
ncbi:prolipoprotein diacylglyceryl transferase family protein [Massilia sp. TSP1-1-2]|uniref:prolipoprotein diacylglyceryl transferase family protein n=1 Tax=Massilia sp. TSP1-1-2 TaxID=2804649 RepID=UPI003CF1D12A